jgi:hypothetical protein
MQKHFQSNSLSLTRLTDYDSQSACLADRMKRAVLAIIDLQMQQTLNTMKQSSSWKANRSSACEEIPSILRIHKRSLQHSQKPITCSYTEPHQSSPCPHPTCWGSILISSSRLWLGLMSGLFPSCFPMKTLHAPFPSPIHSTSISLFLIWSSEWDLVRSAHHKAPCYTVFSIPYNTVPLRP